MSGKIRVLIVDDSAFTRLAIKEILEKDPDIKVVGTARDGLEAVEKVKKLKPDVVTLDVQMPKMDGLQALKIIMEENPVPVVMISALTKEGARVTLEALKLGAVDFITKPSAVLPFDLSEVEREIITKVKNAKHSNPNIIRLMNLRKFKESVVRGNWKNGDKEICVLIGSSTGGPSALEHIIPRLPGDLPASVFVVQHMPRGNFTSQLAERLNSQSELEVKEAENNEIVKKGIVYIAPGGYHMIVKNVLGKKRIKLTEDPPVNAVRPSVDVTAKSLVSAFGKNIVGVILTGMGNDGANGMKLIREKGGKTIACSEDTCVVFGMPKAAIEIGAIDSVKPLYEIAEDIVKFVEVLSNGRN